MIEFVFFDAGETLLSPNPSWSELSTDILVARGHDVDVLRLREAWRQAGERFVQAADEGRTFSTSRDESKTFWMSLYTDLIGRLGITDDGAPAVLYETFSDPANYHLFDDSLPTIEELGRRGLRLGVISNFESWLRSLLDHLGITDRFDVIAISGDLGWEKPDPRIFKWAMEEAGVSAAASVHVGDSPHFDAGPAHDLGMTGVLLDRHGRWTEIEGDYPRIATLGELVELIDAVGN